MNYTEQTLKSDGEARAHQTDAADSRKSIIGSFSPIQQFEMLDIIRGNFRSHWSHLIEQAEYSIEAKKEEINQLKNLLENI